MKDNNPMVQRIYQLSSEYLNMLNNINRQLNKLFVLLKKQEEKLSLRRRNGKV